MCVFQSQQWDALTHQRGIIDPIPTGNEPTLFRPFHASGPWKYVRYRSIGNAQTLFRSTTLHISRLPFLCALCTCTYWGGYESVDKGFWCLNGVSPHTKWLRIRAHDWTVPHKDRTHQTVTQSTVSEYFEVGCPKKRPFNNNTRLYK